MPRARNATVEQQYARNAAVSVSGTSTELCATRLGRSRRVALVLTPLTAGVTVSISFGDQAAILNQGMILNQSQPYAEADSEGFNCWQGAIQAIASGAGSVAVLERYENGTIIETVL